MKHRISISISEQILLKLKERMRNERIANQSSIVEKAVEKFLE
ncbi:ribbon-helix-helix domain-containing protein [Candidatus Woesearchaeota archaeon]|nr:ribbon-helix-helix domain-containing protein [Candidatus Woesearchaeota archaeon]